MGESAKTQSGVSAGIALAVAAMLATLAPTGGMAQSRFTPEANYTFGQMLKVMSREEALRAIRLRAAQERGEADINETYAPSYMLRDWKTSEGRRYADRRARQDADDIQRAHERAEAIAEQEARIEMNRRIAQEQVRGWHRCAAYTRWDRECGGYCVEKYGLYCAKHLKYIPLGEAFCGDDASDREAAVEIFNATLPLLEREEDEPERVEALKRLIEAIEGCRTAYATGGREERDAARKALWDVWHEEIAAIDRRKEERRLKWEREHPEEVAEMKRLAEEKAAKEAEAKRLATAAEAAKRKEETERRIAVLEEAIAEYKSAFDRDEPPDRLPDLGALRIGIETRDGWGREFIYETNGRDYAICSVGADGQFGTEDDVTVIREVEPPKSEIEKMREEIRAARQRLRESR